MRKILNAVLFLMGSCLLSASAMAEMDSKLFAGMKARDIGPAVVSGRVTSVDADEANPDFIVIGTATAGVWISENAGLEWTPVFEQEACASIGVVTIDQSNPNVIWVGTGETNVRNSTSIGCGLYKSIDRGKTWNLIGLENSERIREVALDPADSDIVYVAAMGKLWAANEERGLYKSTDGGDSWERILYVDEDTGATDIQIDPANPNKLFASMWEFRRWPYFMKSGGEGSGLYVSHDAGKNWTQLTEEDGLPSGELGRIGVAIAPTNSQRVYALIESEKTGLLRSDDGGMSWATVNTETYIGNRPFYYTHISVHPDDEDTVYHLSSRVRESIDGGKTFAELATVDCCAPANVIHVDIHALWLNPENPDHFIFGGDAGLAITRNGGESSRFIGNLPLAQFYHIAVDNDPAYHVYGGMQDNGSWRGAAEVFENGGIRNLHWQEVAMGDGFDTLPDPSNSRRGISETQGGTLIAWSLDTGEQRYVKPNGPEDSTELRFNWNSGMAQSLFDSNTIFYGSQFLHKSTDRGETWEIISGDLTTNNPEFQTYKQSGGLTPDTTTAENYTTIVAISPSPLEEGIIWVGTDDGRVHVTRDGGESWNSVEGNLRRGPRGAWVPMIEPSRHDPSVAYVVLDDHRRGDNEPHAYKLTNYGQQWSSMVTDNISGYALSVRQDHVDEDLLFLGTEFGLYFSTDGGEEWTRWREGVPTISVMDLAIQQRENDLVVGTHGRGAFIIDDYSALRGLTDDSFDNELELLSLADGQQYKAMVTPSTRFTGAGEYRADNEPYGVLITFMASGDHLKHPDHEQHKANKAAQRASEDGDEDSDASDLVTITVKTKSGDVVRVMKESMHQGVNRVVWDLRRDGFLRAPPAKAPANGVMPAGAEILPGTYVVEISNGEVTDSGTVEVLPDPDSDFSMDAQRANYDARVLVDSLSSDMHGVLTKVMNTKRDVKALETLLNSEPYKEHKEALSAEINKVNDALDDAERLFRHPEGTQGGPDSTYQVGSHIGIANRYVTSTRAAPNEAARMQIEKARDVLAQATSQVNSLLEGDVANLKRLVRQHGIELFAH